MASGIDNTDFFGGNLTETTGDGGYAITTELIETWGGCPADQQAAGADAIAVFWGILHGLYKIQDDGVDSGPASGDLEDYLVIRKRSRTVSNVPHEIFYITLKGGADAHFFGAGLTVDNVFGANYMVENTANAGYGIPDTFVEGLGNCPTGQETTGSHALGPIRGILQGAFYRQAQATPPAGLSDVLTINKKSRVVSGALWETFIVTFIGGVSAQW